MDLGENEEMKSTGDQEDSRSKTTIIHKDTRQESKELSSVSDRQREVETWHDP